MKKNRDKEKGNILISSIFILITMNLLGAGIMQNSTRDLQLANFKFVDSEIHHLAESCVQDMVTKFETLDRKPDDNEEASLNITDSSPTYLKKEESYVASTDESTAGVVSTDKSTGGVVSTDKSTGGVVSTDKSTAGVVSKDESNNTSKVNTKLEGFAHNCNITYLGITQTQTGEAGSEISVQNGEYNASAKNKSMYYYQIVSTGTGPEEAEKTINTIVSVTF